MFEWDFSLILLLSVALTGAVWLGDLVWRLLRKKVIYDHRSVGGVQRGNWVVDFAKAFFPVLMVVFLLRSFVVEPFRIPSGSMLPTLQDGDFILVSKFEYGIRLPVSNRKMVELSYPERGDVMVFKFPHDDKVNFIKRVVGIPGDRILYQDKKLTINGKPISQNFIGESLLNSGSSREVTVTRFKESLGDESHTIQVNFEKQGRAGNTLQFTVPEGKYFVLGDNRDYSNDSRFWGFVPEENIIGRAFFIWFSWDSGVNWSRIAQAIE